MPITEREIQELRDVYEKSKKVLTRRKATLHRLRMQLRKAGKRFRKRQAITAKRKRKLDRALDEKNSTPRERVVAWSLDRVGTHETPGLPNQGPLINEWNRAVGMEPGPYAYWCGSFCHAALKRGELDFPDWIRYTPSIYNFARAQQHGLSIVTRDKAQPGDMVLYNFDGGVVDHVGIYIGNFETVEGNTSPGTGGSQNNGGGVYKRNPRATYYFVHIDYDKAPQRVPGVEKH